MSKSYRIRTQPGVDKSIKVLIDQEFDYLEILSLKILQTDIYTRQCADYGVIVGRVSVNNGFGIPNAKISIFIPIDSKDQSNPVISELYPYKSLSDLNDDGYRYNLLPYVKSYSAHVPTGTFFTRNDVLTDPTLIEVYDKYYKYNAVTNDSGDYMIFGVPVGVHTVVLDVDLSDIGEFSLSPQDLIRMGVATESQVSGTKFKSSNNLRELPQIVTVNRSIEVEPLWGQPEICNLGITRTDFDLSGEANIQIKPTSIFIGSLISSNDSEFLPRNCKPRLKSGSLCSLVTGPGEILAIRQTVSIDTNGRPILETVDLDSGGKVIDDNGTWLVDVPMNLDYYVTNEFGEQVLSNDPKKGIPTKGKYRFKVKWNQPPSLSETVKRGYFLVPNIREYGWLSSTSGPNDNDVEKSYAFSLNWDDYVDIQSAIDCEDTFYMMQYNKVYTVSQMIDQYRKGYLNNRFIGIKNILDESCESDNNKFPTNDSVFRFDLIYFLFWIMIFLFRPIFLTLIPVVHILWFVLKIIALILTVVIYPIMTIVITICKIVRAIISALANLPKWLGGRFFRKLKDELNCPTFADVNKMVRDINNFPDKLKNIKIPNLSYPECSFCDCGDPGNLPQNESNVSQLQVDTSNTSTPEGVGSSLLTPFQIFTQYIIKVSDVGSQSQPNVYTQDSIYQSMFAGQGLGDSELGTLISSTRVPGMIISTTNDESSDTNVDSNSPEYAYFTSSLNVSERLNLFNTKAKYFDQSQNNPGGGVNRIKVSFQPDLNPNKFHYDNVLALVCTPTSSFLESGNLITFQDLLLSKDKNVITNATTINQFGTNTITGTPINVGTLSSPAQISFNYAKPDGTGNQNITYNIVSSDNDVSYAKFPIDVEYFQVITGMTYSQYVSMCNNSVITQQDWDNRNSFNYRFLSNDMVFSRVFISNESQLCDSHRYLDWSPIIRKFKPTQYYKDINNQRVYFLVRGVDPNTTRTKVEYDLSRLFGFNFGNPATIFNGDNFKLNYPIQNNINCVSHNSNDNITSSFYFDSFHFKPAQTGSFSFLSFTSNLHTYYSNLDNNNLTFKPSNNSIPLSNVTQLNSNPIKVINNYTNTLPPPQLPLPSSPINYGSQGWNGFIVEWNYYSTTVDCNPSIYVINPITFWRGQGLLNISPTYNRGYYPGEIVEGGSMFYQKVNINQYFNDVNPIETITDYYSPKYSETLSITFNTNSINPNKIVMRSDRLPTSTNLQTNLNNSFPLHTNTMFAIFTVSDDGVATITNTNTNGSNSIFSGQSNEYVVDQNEPSVVNQVVESFNCGKMAPLNCYTSNNNTLSIKSKDDSCWSFGNGNSKFDGGCYILITQPIISLLDLTDFKVVFEWTNRIQTMFGACRDVFSHLFTNNWVNGTLYAFSFSNDVIYDNNNQPISRYCYDNLYFHQPTKNFYYRSSPWNNLISEFVGDESPRGSIGGYGGNFNNLKYPTTIMDLGPRSSYLQEIVYSDKYDGYIFNKMTTTSYGDVSELLNLLIITRLATPSFLNTIIGVGILSFFSRTKNMVDGDYAQMISINSEIGVAPFQSINYPDSPPGLQNPIYYESSSGVNNRVLGIFFSSDTQIRDFITPKRTIINGNVSITNTCAFNNFPVFSQTVPFYQWELRDNGPSIFGTQKNEWKTDPIINNVGFFSHKYQSLDRVTLESRYMRTSQNVELQYYKGYIYSVDINGNLNPEINSIIPNTDNFNDFSVGSPFHFYFGLKKGKSSFDRFTTKWIDTTTTI